LISAFLAFGQTPIYTARLRIRD